MKLAILIGLEGRITINSGYFRSLIKLNYKTIGIISFLAGMAYTARAFLLIKAPGELPMTNTYPFVVGVLLCMSAAGIYVFGTDREFNFSCSKTEFIITLICFIAFALTFEKAGAIKASFIFSFIFGTVWNRKVHTSEKTVKISYFKANILKITENILVSCISSAGIWIVFERIFSLSLP